MQEFLAERAWRVNMVPGSDPPPPDFSVLTDEDFEEAYSDVVLSKFTFNEVAEFVAERAKAPK